MALPEPQPGLVVSYAFLWNREQRIGREEGIKARPCVIVVAVRRLGENHTRVRVAAITHRAPDPSSKSIELPAAVKRHLHLDSERSWVVLDELNEFRWPGFDLRPITGRRESFAYGLLPPRFFDQVRSKLADVWRAGPGRVVRRD